MSNKASGRSYIYDTAYESTPLQKKRRAARNAARAEMKKTHRINKTQDINHVVRNLSGNLSNDPGNLTIESRASNRSRNSPKNGKG